MYADSKFPASFPSGFDSVLLAMDLMREGDVHSSKDHDECPKVFFSVYKKICRMLYLLETIQIQTKNLLFVQVFFS